MKRLLFSYLSCYLRRPLSACGVTARHVLSKLEAPSFPKATSLRSGFWPRVSPHIRLARSWQVSETVGFDTTADNQYFHWVGLGSSADQIAGGYGNFGRCFSRPWNSVMMISRSRRGFRLTERHALLLCADAFSLFNYTQFFNPGSSASVNAIASPTFDEVQFARDPRLLQVELQFRF